MSRNCFVQQEATLEIISNVANFCSECYSDINETEVIFYDMLNCRYLCESCQEKYEIMLDDNCELLTPISSSLFN